MKLNIFTNKAIVFFEGIWRFVLGESKDNRDFVFILNGRIESVHDGNWSILGSGRTDEEAIGEAIQSNLYELGRTIRTNRG
jgi:hypothetical protein